MPRSTPLLPLIERHRAVELRLDPEPGPIARRIVLGVDSTAYPLTSADGTSVRISYFWPTAGAEKQETHDDERVLHEWLRKEGFPPLETWMLRQTSEKQGVVLEASANSFAIAERLRGDRARAGDHWFHLRLRMRVGREKTLWSSILGDKIRDELRQR